MHPDLTTRVLALIAKRVDPLHLPKLDLHASLRGDLGLCEVDLISVSCDAEEEWGFLFEGDPERGWSTPADIVASVGRLAKARAHG